MTRPHQQQPAAVPTGTRPDRAAITAPHGSRRRAEQTEAVIGRYTHGLPIRVVAAELGLSYGKVHALLVESRTPRRPVGGAQRRTSTRQNCEE